MARPRSRNRPPERDSLFGAAILSVALHAAALVAAVVAWPFVAPPISLDDIVAVEIVDVASETNIAPQVEAKEPEPEPEPEPPVPEELPPPPMPEELPPPPPPEEEEALVVEEEKPEPPKPEPPKPQPPTRRFADVTPRAKPKPEPKKQEFDLSQIDKAIERAAKTEPKKDEPPAKSKATQTLRGAGAQSALTMSEIDALRGRLAKCWNVPVGAPDPAALVFRVRFSLNEDGTVASAPQLLDQGRLSDPYFRAAVDAAIRAIHICGPYELPPEKYASWNEIVVTFDPREMAGY